MGGGHTTTDILLHRCKLLEGNDSERLPYKAQKTACVRRLGSASSDGSQSGSTFDTNGIFQNICACTHGYAIGNILEQSKINTDR